MQWAHCTGTQLPEEIVAQKTQCKVNSLLIFNCLKVAGNFSFFVLEKIAMNFQTQLHTVCRCTCASFHNSNAIANIVNPRSRPTLLWRTRESLRESRQIHTHSTHRHTPPNSWFRIVYWVREVSGGTNPSIRKIRKLNKQHRRRYLELKTIKKCFPNHFFPFHSQKFVNKRRVN